MRAAHRFVSVALVCLSMSTICIPTIAHADDISDARAAFERGLALLDDERFADAARAFESSIEHHPTAGAHYNLGLALRGIGHIVAAITAFDRVLERYPSSDPALRSDAEIIRSELERRVAHLTLAVSGEPDEILLDGRALVLEADAERVELRLDPGPHVVVTRRSGSEDQRAEVDLGGGESASVTLDAAASPRDAPADVPLLEDVDDGASNGVSDGLMTAGGGDGEGAESNEIWVWILVATAAVIGGLALGLYLYEPDRAPLEEGTFGRVFYNLRVAF